MAQSSAYSAIARAEFGDARRTQAAAVESNLHHRGAGTAPALAPALLVCLRLPAEFAAEFVDRDTMLLTVPMRVLVTESRGEDT